MDGAWMIVAVTASFISGVGVGFLIGIRFDEDDDRPPLSEPMSHVIAIKGGVFDFEKDG